MDYLYVGMKGMLIFDLRVDIAAWSRFFMRPVSLYDTKRMDLTLPYNVKSTRTNHKRSLTP